MNVQTLTYEIGAWRRGLTSRIGEQPPHRSPMQAPGEPAQLFPRRHTAGDHPYAVQDYDGCEAAVLALRAAQVTSGPSGGTGVIDEEAPDGPGPTAERRRAEVLARLRVGGWVEGNDLATEECGGSEGLRRLRELRAEGHRIVKRHNPDPGATSYLYMLIEHRADCQRDHPTDTDCDWVPFSA